MKKIIVIIGVLTTTSCGMFTTLTNEQKENRDKVEYQIDKAYFEYITKRDSLILEYKYNK
jgi:predicted secreted protein